MTNQSKELLEWEKDTWIKWCEFNEKKLKGFIKSPTRMNLIFDFFNSTSLQKQELVKKIEGMRVGVSRTRDPWSIEVSHIEDKNSFNQALSDILKIIEESLLSGENSNPYTKMKKKI